MTEIFAIINTMDVRKGTIPGSFEFIMSNLDLYGEDDPTFKMELACSFKLNLMELNTGLERLLQDGDNVAFRQTIHKVKTSLRLTAGDVVVRSAEKIIDLMNSDNYQTSALKAQVNSLMQDSSRILMNLDDVILSFRGSHGIHNNRKSV